jgi:hypothetical protein
MTTTGRGLVIAVRQLAERTIALLNIILVWTRATAFEQRARERHLRGYEDDRRDARLKKSE